MDPRRDNQRAPLDSRENFSENEIAECSNAIEENISRNSAVYIEEVYIPPSQKIRAICTVGLPFAFHIYIYRHYNLLDVDCSQLHFPRRSGEIYDIRIIYNDKHQYRKSPDLI